MIVRKLAWALVAPWLLTLAGTAGAAPLQPAQVITDPAWVVHLDCDALRQTSLGKEILRKLDQPEAGNRFESFKAVFGLDPRKDLHGVTLYGATKEETDGVLLASADFDASRLLALVQANKDYRTNAHGAHIIHSWVDDKAAAKSGTQSRAYGTLYHGKILIVGQQERRVTEALDVLDGKQASLTTNTNYSRLGAAGEGVFLTGGARALNVPGTGLEATLLKQAKLLWLSAREAQGQVELKLTLETADAGAAKQLGDAGRGFLAVLALQTNQPAAVKLAQAITLEQAGAGLMAKLSLPAADVVRLVQERLEK